MKNQLRIMFVLGMAIFGTAALVPLPPPEASINQVNAGTSRSSYVSPYGLANWSGGGGGGGNSVTAASVAASSGLIWTSGGANRTAVATDTVPTLNVDTFNPTTVNWGSVIMPKLNGGFGADVSASTGVPYFSSGTLSFTGTTGTSTFVRSTNATVAVTTSPGGADNTCSGSTITGLNNSGGVTQWDVVYLNSSSVWVVADANGSGTYPARGLAVATVANGGSTTVLTEGIIRHDAWTWTPGGIIYLSTTAGQWTQTQPATSGDKVQVIGYAIDADTMYVKIAPDYFEVGP
jgi:hypothetical protein